MPQSPMEWLGVAFYLCWIILGLISAAHAAMFKREATSAALWVILTLLLPIAGPWLYWVFGINRIERRAVRRSIQKGRPCDIRETVYPSASDAEIAISIGHLHSLRSVADRVSRMPLMAGNTVKPLHCGEQAYPEMLNAIETATRSVTLASYIFDWDEVGRRFCEALCKAARRGVRVHVLLDGIGALGNFSRIGRRLLRDGAQVQPFFPLRFPLGRLRINLRNHRKILVVDGRIGFTGGMNISQRHMANQSDPNRVEDLHFRVEGPVVGQLQYTFCEDWFLACEQVLSDPDYFPTLDQCGKSVCRGIPSGPDEDLGRIYLFILAALEAARSSVRMVTPYFVPTSELTSAMIMASLRGVAVTLILPSVTDHVWMRWAADAQLWPLLERGVRVFHRPPPFVHTKLMIVDDQWMLLGSANLDRRSFRLNFEFNVEAYDQELAQAHSHWIDNFLPACTETTLEMMDGRSTFRRIRDGATRLFSPHL